MLQWLFRVVVHVTLTPHVVAAFVVFLERFVKDPLTIVGFLVPRQQIFLVDPVTQGENGLLFLGIDNNHIIGK